jgi:hypothetical protein
MFQGQAGNHPRELWTSQPDEMKLKRTDPRKDGRSPRSPFRTEDSV